MYELNYAKSKTAEGYVIEQATKAGIQAWWTSFSSKKETPDIVTSNGLYLDVKLSSLSKGASCANNGIKRKPPHYLFNLHHHGIKQIAVDYFIFVLGNKTPPDLYVIPAKTLTGKTFYISQAQLSQGKLDWYKDNWSLIKNDPGRPFLLPPKEKSFKPTVDLFKLCIKADGITQIKFAADHDFNISTFNMALYRGNKMPKEIEQAISEYVEDHWLMKAHKEHMAK